MVTSQEILLGFKDCKNPGEQIDLFERLATDSEPPISAFYEILEQVKLEPVVVLTIQVFGKIAWEKKDILKESEDLLALLSRQAQSGQTDLIRWSAATTIEKIGYDFVAVSRYMSEDPNVIAEKIISSKIKRFDDINLYQSNDYKDFVRFWTYGAFEELKELSANYPIPATIDSWLSVRGNLTNKLENYVISAANQIQVSIEVMKQLSLKGLKEINLAMANAEKLGESAREVDENQLFEFIALTSFDVIPLEDSFIREWYQAKNYDIDLTEESRFIWLSVLEHCSQSNSQYIRYVAAKTIHDGNPDFGLGKEYYQFLKDNESIIAEAVVIFYYQSTSQANLGFSYLELLSLSELLDQLSQQLDRKQVKEYCKNLKHIFHQETQTREELFHQAKQKAMYTRQNIEQVLEYYKDTDLEIYSKYFEEVKLPTSPNFDICINQDENYLRIFKKYQENLINLFKKSVKKANSYLQESLNIKEKSVSKHENIIFEEEKQKKKISTVSFDGYHWIFGISYFLWLIFFLNDGVHILTIIFIASWIVLPILALISTFIIGLIMETLFMAAIKKDMENKHNQVIKDNRILLDKENQEINCLKYKLNHLENNFLFLNN